MRNRPSALACLACLALACLPQVSPAAPAVTLPELTARLLPGTQPSIFNDLAHVRPVRGAQPATLQLDLAHHQILDATGRIVAGPQSVRPLYLQSVMDKWRYAAALGDLAKAHPQELNSDWGHEDRLARIAGSVETITVTHVTLQRQLLLFGIGPSGDIYVFLHPWRIATDPHLGDTLIARGTVGPPFGAEHLVAVTAADPERMQQLRAWLAEAGDSHGLVDTQGELLRQIEALKDVRIGLLLSFSCGSVPECARH